MADEQGSIDSTRDDDPAVEGLFRSLQRHLPDLEKLLDDCSGHWGYDDPVYRFYHQSFKIYGLQQQTTAIVDRLQALVPERPLNEWFMQIVGEGTGRSFSPQDNQRWLAATRPIVEAFFHARYFLAMAVQQAKELPYPPRLMPSGWAALLYLYGMR